MKKWPAYLLCTAAAVMLLMSCGDKNSNEACLHEVTMNLDRGNFDAVLASSCADTLQRGAAYFGRAGFDTVQVINKFIETGVTTGTSTGSSDLTAYMTALVSKVTESTLTDLDSSAAEYSSIAPSSETYYDAQFYLSLVETMDSLSLLKIIVSDSSGSIDTSCDINSNSVADGADAASCALIAATNINTASATACSGATYSPASPVDITFPGKSGTYSGLNITLTGTATFSCPAAFKKLLYKTSSGEYWVVTTSADETCIASDHSTWPCPIEQNGQPLDLVAAINSSLDSAVSALDTALTTTGSDVQTSILDIKSTACPSGTCTSSDIANYLQTIQ